MCHERSWSLTALGKERCRLFPGAQTGVAQALSEMSVATTARVRGRRILGLSEGIELETEK